ncbi:metallophosphoesterase [Streptomyces sp. NPDC048717]|uniref:metallophosphoesterase n=1 Tax=Streptomyces sp. NPDC048717 TaxID=3154928 RepID=UPI00343A9B08
MTQGDGQEPVVRTATLRDFRVPPYAKVPVQGQPADPRTAPAHAPDPATVPAAPMPADATLHLGSLPLGHPLNPYRGEGSEPYDVFAAGAPAPAHAPVAPGAVPEPLAPAPAPVARTTDGHPGNAFPEDALPEGYTPTERDLPVINRGDTVQVHVDPLPRPDAQASDGRGPLYVVGDVHGYLDELVAALRAQGLIDENGGWAAGNARLWFLGDFTDRGPDGIGVIDLVMRLSAEAAAAGGYCKALMGNHELLLIGAKRFGDTPVNSGAGTATFQAAWLLNGGQKHDMDRLQDVHLQWMSRLDAVVAEDDHLLLHSDTTAYLDYGATIEDVNDTVHEILTRNDADEVWDLFRKFTKRFAFRDEASGPGAVRELLATYGGRRIVHGHSPIPYLLGQVGTEDGEDDERPVVDGPHVYADGLAIAMDGGVTMAGKLLVVQLPLPA